MKKLLLSIIIILFMRPLVVEAAGVSSTYGDIKLSDIEITDEKIIFTSNVNAKDKDSHYFVSIECYKYENYSLNWAYGIGAGEDDVFEYGNNLTIKSFDLLCNFEGNVDDGIYCFRAYLHDADNYDWENYLPSACFGYSDYVVKVITWKNEQLFVNDYDCNKNGHIYDKWKTATEATIKEAGVKTRTCYNCGHEETKSIKKLKPTIKLSSTTKKVKELHSFELTVRNIAKGDSIASVKVNVKPHFIPGDFRRLIQTKLSDIKCGKDANCRLYREKPQILVALIRSNIRRIGLN